MNEWYEAREDARSEYISQILQESHDADFDEHVTDAIKSGDFDTEVLERAIEIVQSFGVVGIVGVDFGIVRSLKEILRQVG